MLRTIAATMSAALSSRHVKVRSPSSRPLMLLIHVALKEAAGGAPEVSIKDLRRDLKISQASTSRTVAAHLRSGALECVQTDDSRKTCVRLTRSGNAFIDEVLGAMQRAAIAEAPRQKV
jgi:DNA-binding MarR family transcriptional regulator